MRFTKIIATLGPATSSVDAIERLAKLGVSVFRLNFAHGDYAVHRQTIRAVRTVRARGYSLASMADTKGPEVRTGDVERPLPVRKGERVLFTATPTGREKMKVIQVNYSSFAEDVKHARTILIDNGAMEFRLESIERSGAVVARALQSGRVGSRRHVNLPGAHISLPSFTKKDRLDTEFCVREGVDFFATSFVRSGEDIQLLRRFLGRRGSNADIIAKIESPEAVKNIESILRYADGIMVARGDLGSEVPFEKVPAIQDGLVRKCRAASKPVIVATHMLESMILSPTPTRAEVTDIAHAARTQADCTMLSGETTTGLYPFKAVEAMDRVLRENEQLEPEFQLFPTPADGNAGDIDAVRREQALAASVLATKLSAQAIVVISKTGRTARAVSTCRPPIPVHAFTGSEEVQRKLLLVWGIVPHTVELSVSHPERTLSAAIRFLRRHALVKRGKRVVVVSDMRSSGNAVMTIQVRTIE